MAKPYKRTVAKTLQELRGQPWSPSKETRMNYLKRRHQANYHIKRPEVRQRIFSRDDHRCVKCGSGKDLTIDHIISIYSGGSDEDDNLQTLCNRCNGGKAP